MGGTDPVPVMNLNNFESTSSASTNRKEARIGLSKVPTAILQGVQKHWGEHAVTNGAHTIY